MVTNTKPIETTANPTTYQIAGNRSSLPFLAPGFDPEVSLRDRSRARRYPWARSGWSIPRAGRFACFNVIQRLSRPTVGDGRRPSAFYRPNSRTAKPPVARGSSIRTTAERAATIILDGVRKNKPRVLVGNDAKALDALVRATGAGYQRLVAAVTARTVPN